MESLWELSNQRWLETAFIAMYGSCELISVIVVTESTELIASKYFFFILSELFTTGDSSIPENYLRDFSALTYL